MPKQQKMKSSTEKPKYSIPKSTLSRWAKRNYVKASDICSSGPRTYLTPDQEEALAAWYGNLADKHHCISVFQALDVASKFMVSQNVELRAEVLSRPWLAKFCKRWDLSEKIAFQTEAHRSKALISGSIINYIKFVEVYSEDNGIKSMWNCDETGISGAKEHQKGTKVIARKGQAARTQMRTWPGHVTLLAFVGNNGRHLPPLIITEGIEFTTAYYQAFDAAQETGDFIPDAQYVMAGYLDDKKKKRANKGSMTKRFFREYVTKTVIPSIKKEEKPALLLLDGHESHIDLECLTMLRDAGIHVIQEPAHCSSAVQVCV